VIPYLSSIIVDSLLICKITLVTNQKLVDSFSGISINFLQPLLNVAESFLVCDIVDNDDTVSTSVVGGCDSSETLLTSSIPLKNNMKCYQRVLVNRHWPHETCSTYDLQLHSLSFQLDSADFLVKRKT
jgi:hypothetical protein